MGDSGYEVEWGRMRRVMGGEEGIGEAYENPGPAEIGDRNVLRGSHGG